MNDKEKVVNRLTRDIVKTRIKFEVSLLVNLPKQDFERLQKEIEDTMGTSLDIAVSDLSYLDDKTDEYTYLSKDDEDFEEDYTKVIDLEMAENE